MTEAELLTAVVGLIDEVSAAHRGRVLLWHHCRDSRHCDGRRGFPDLIIAGDNGIIVAELKSEDGEQSADQQLWAWMLSDRIADGVQIWRPAQLESGWIRAELESIV